MGERTHFDQRMLHPQLHEGEHRQYRDGTDEYRPESPIAVPLREEAGSNDNAGQADCDQQQRRHRQVSLFTVANIGNGRETKQEGNHEERNHGVEDPMPVEEFHDQSAEHRADGRSGAGYETDQAKHHTTLAERSFFQNDVGQQRQGDTRSKSHDESRGEQHRKIQRERTDHGTGRKQYDCGDEQRFRRKTTHHERRGRNRHRKQQKIARGEPLHHVGGDGELLHQRGIGDVQRRFGQNAQKRQDGERHHHDGEFSFAHVFAGLRFRLNRLR